MDNLNSALTTWNNKLAELWTLISTSPEGFKGGGVWEVIQNINGALQAVGYGLLVLFFAAGVVKTCGSFAELKKPEMAFRCFVRFVLAQAAIGHGMELMMALFNIAQGMVTTIMSSSGLTAVSATTLPDEMVTTIESVGFIDSIPLWAITLLGSLFIWVLSLVMILTVYSRFFKLPPCVHIHISRPQSAGNDGSRIRQQDKPICTVLTGDDLNRNAGNSYGPGLNIRHGHGATIVVRGR